MGGFKFTGLAAGSSAGESVRYEQFASPPAIGSTTPTTGAFTQITSTVATGTPPLVVASTTEVANLKAATATLATTATSATNATNATTAATVSTTVASGAVGTTQARFDNTTKIATTAFVQEVGLHASVGANITSGSTLAISTVGSVLYYDSASAGTVTLPLGVGAPDSIITIYCKSTGPLTISRQGADVIRVNSQVTLTSVILQGGESIQLIAASGSWTQVTWTRQTIYTTQVTPFPGAGTSITQTHTMGDVNFNAVLELTNLSAEFGYSAGDTVQWSGLVSDGSIVSNIWKSATEVGALNQTGASTWLIRNKTTGASVVPTPASWAYRFCLTK
jgi:hypothetical protein